MHVPSWFTPRVLCCYLIRIKSIGVASQGVQAPPKQLTLTIFFKVIVDYIYQLELCCMFSQVLKWVCEHLNLQNCWVICRIPVILGRKRR